MSKRSRRDAETPPSSRRSRKESVKLPLSKRTRKEYQSPPPPVSGYQSPPLPVSSGAPATSYVEPPPPPVVDVVAPLGVQIDVTNLSSSSLSVSDVEEEGPFSDDVTISEDASSDSLSASEEPNSADRAFIAESPPPSPRRSALKKNKKSNGSHPAFERSMMDSHVYPTPPSLAQSAPMHLSRSQISSYLDTRLSDEQLERVADACFKKWLRTDGVEQFNFQAKKLIKSEIKARSPAAAVKRKQRATTAEPSKKSSKTRSSRKNSK